jgi:hypothetical protein
VPIRNHKRFHFNIDSKRRICPSTRRPLVANAVSKDSGIFNGRSISINDLLK